METKKNKEQLVKRQAFTPATLHVREATESDEPSRTITGYAILFDTPSEPLWSDEESEAREVIDPEAVTKELLDGMDIKMTMYHNRELLLARSNKGEGTLDYGVDNKGVWFSFDAPRTQHGDEALELVKRGDLSGCSFAFTTRYYDDACVERTANVVGGITMITYRVKAITGVYDFTITDNPAYTDTSVEAREFVEGLKQPAVPDTAVDDAKVREQVSCMRREAEKKII